MKKVWFMLAMMLCILASCSDGGGENPIEPTPKPEEVKTEIIIDSSIISNGLSFSAAEGEQSISFSVNANWTLSIASTTSGTTWCKASATSGSKGTANVKFTIGENTDYEDRSVSVTIKAGTVSKTFTITQKGVDALLVTTTKYEVAQEGGQIEIEVKANIDYKMEISEEAKDWIQESSGRALTTYKHKLDIAMNEDAEKREGEITFKSGDKVETVKVYQAGGAILLLSQNEYDVSDKGDTISVDIKSNIDFGVQMPDVDWIIDEASSRGLSSHTLKYIVAANEGYDNRSADIVFFDKNSDLKDTLKVVQAQKDAIILSEKSFDVAKEGGFIEVKVNTNVDFDVQIPTDITWVTKTDSRAMTEKVINLKVIENTSDESRSANITIINKKSQLSETIIVTQKGNITIVTLKEAGTLISYLGKDCLSIKSLKINGPINGNDVIVLRRMKKLINLDIKNATIVEGGNSYAKAEWASEEPREYYTENDIVGGRMFNGLNNLTSIILPDNSKRINAYCFIHLSKLEKVVMPNTIKFIGDEVFKFCTSLKVINLSDSLEYLGDYSFYKCESLTQINIPDSIKVIEDYSFAYCKSLSSVVLAKKLERIGFGAFEHTSISNIDFPENLNSISRYAFLGCPIKKIIIPSSITYLGAAALKCEDLKEVYLKKKPSLIKTEEHIFGDHNYNNSTLYIPKGYLEDCLYTEFGKFKKIVEMD